MKPLTFTPRPDGGVAVEVDQVVRDLEGGLLSEGPVGVTWHLFRNRLIVRMDIEESRGER